jgi:hypothetical protein
VRGPPLRTIKVRVRETLWAKVGDINLSNPIQRCSRAFLIQQPRIPVLCPAMTNPTSILVLCSGQAQNLTRQQVCRALTRPVEEGSVTEAITIKSIRVTARFLDWVPTTHTHLRPFSPTLLGDFALAPVVEPRRGPAGSKYVPISV